MTDDLRKLTNEQLVDKFKYDMTCHEEAPDAEAELLRRLTLTAQPEGDELFAIEVIDYDRSKVSPTPWSLYYGEDFGWYIKHSNCKGWVTSNPLPKSFSEADINHAVICVNSHDALTDLVRRLAGALKQDLQVFNKLTESIMTDEHPVYERIEAIDALLTKAGVPDMPGRCEDNPLLELLLSFDGILGNVQNAEHKNLDRDALLADYWMSVNRVIELRNELARKLGIKIEVPE